MNDGKLAAHAQLIRQYGWVDKYRIGEIGGRNSRLDEVQAAVLLSFLEHLDDTNARRRAIANRISTEISNDAIITPDVRGKEYVAHLYVIRTEHRDALATYLRQQSIASDVHYPIPDHKQPIFGERFSDVRLANTEKLCREILTLPCFPEMSDAQVSHVISAINKWRP
jgi:dTDP-4-amino-4,6-dideoxygalactose transaminase